MENKNEMYDILKESILALNKASEKFSQNSDLQQEIDYKIQDILHYIENETIKPNSKQSYRLVKQLKELRSIRRKLKEEYEVYKTYLDNNGKMQNDSNRNILLSQLNNKLKSLDSEYNYRIYTKEQIEKYINDEKITNIDNKN